MCREKEVAGIEEAKEPGDISPILDCCPTTGRSFVWASAFSGPRMPSEVVNSEVED